MINQTNLKLDEFCCIGSYELTEKDFFINSANYCVKMSYYQFNVQEILQKAKERYSKEKAAEYYLKNKEALKEKSKN